MSKEFTKSHGIARVAELSQLVKENDNLKRKMKSLEYEYKSRLNAVAEQRDNIAQFTRKSTCNETIKIIRKYLTENGFTASEFEDLFIEINWIYKRLEKGAEDEKQNN